MSAGPATVEVFINGQPIGNPFVAEELTVTESKHTLVINARRSGGGLADQSGVPGATGTPLTEYFGGV